MENYELGRKVLDHLDAHPESLEMSIWGAVTACGTVACLAGHTMLQAGYTLWGIRFYRPDGQRLRHSEGTEAGGLLGMEFEEMRVFHDCKNGPARFREMVEAAEKRAADEGRLA